MRTDSAGRRVGLLGKHAYRVRVGLKVGRDLTPSETKFMWAHRMDWISPGVCAERILAGGGNAFATCDAGQILAGGAS